MSTQSLIGKQLDEYRLDLKLGEGGMASVYRALDVRLNRYAAVKVIRTSLRSDSEYTKRFQREAQAIAQLDHPNIITLYRFGEIDGLLYMAMQYVDGADLAAVIESFRKDGDFVEFKDVIHVAHELGAGLDYAHAHGVIHRDIKPSNIMINRDGRVLITDFGLALLTEIGTHGEIFGSPHYIAPEQAISSAGAVPQSDLYAMAIVLYEMLTGTVPFNASEPLDIAMQHMSDPVPSPREFRPELSEAVEKVLFKVLEKDPKDRYETGKELANALQTALQAKSPTVRTTIINKVSQEREANPLSPIPPVMMPTTQPTLPLESPQAHQTSAIPETPAAKRSSWPLYALGGIGAALLILLMTFIGSGSGDNNTALSTVGPTADAANLLPTIMATEAEPVVIATSVPAQPSNEISPTAMQQVATATPPTPASYAIVIRWQGDDSLFVTNITSELEFPLTDLALVGNGQVNGSEWDVDRLANNQCVAVWKDSGNPRAAETSCSLVGRHVERDGPNRFWKSSFSVNYNGVTVTTCESSPCIVQIRP